MKNFRRHMLALTALMAIMSITTFSTVRAGHGQGTTQEKLRQRQADAQKQPEGKKQGALSNGTADSTQISCYTSGTGSTYIKACISDTGNVVYFESPQGYVQINGGEGYVLCSTSTNSAYDAGFAESGFGPPTINQPNGPNTLPLYITRTTSDGVFQLTQSYDFRPMETALNVTMQVKNLSTSTIADVMLHRYMDADVDNSYATNRFDQSQDSVWGLNVNENIYPPPLSHGMMLTALSFSVPHSTAVELYTDWDPFKGGTAKSCSPRSQSTPTFGINDYIGRVLYDLGSLSPKGIKSVIIQYRRF